MKDQVLKLMAYFGINATVLAEEIGVQRSSISHILSGRNQPSYDFIRKLLSKYPSVNAEWLISGKGTMLKEIHFQNQIPEPDLFSSVKLKEDNKKIVYENSGLNINKEDAQKTEIEENSKVTNVNKAERIVFFYPDDSFKEYIPGK